MAKGIKLSEAAAAEIEKTVRAKRSAGLSLGRLVSESNTAQRTQSGGGGPTKVIVRDLVNPAGQALLVERAVRHPDYNGDSGDLTNLGRWIAKSERDESEPVLEGMGTSNHMFAGDYVHFLWPVGEPTQRRTYILNAWFVQGGWEVDPEWRFLVVQLMQNARIGSCQPHEELAGLMETLT